jgi:hypothetical protein
MAFSTYGGNLVLDWLLSNASVTRPTAWYVSLHTADPGLTGASEVTTGVDSDYVRKSVTFAAASALQKASDAAVTWTANAGATTYVVTHVGIWDAATTGNFLNYGALAVPETVVASGTFNLSIGRLIAAVI